MINDLNYVKNAKCVAFCYSKDIMLKLSCMISILHPNVTLKRAKNSQFWPLKFRNSLNLNSGIDIETQFRNSGIRDRYCNP